MIPVCFVRGCIEDELIARVRSHGITRTVPEVLVFGVSADEAHRFGLPCDGTIELAVEPLTEPHSLADLLDRLDRHELSARRVDLSTGNITLTRAAAGAVQENAAEQEAH